MEKYSFDSKTYPVLSLMGFLMLLVNVFLYVQGRSLSGADFLQHNNSYAVYDLLLLVLRIAFTVWAVAVAKKLDRSQFLWAVLVFFFTPIALMVLGSRGVKIRPDVKPVFDKHYATCVSELNELKAQYNRKECSDDEYHMQSEELLQRNEELMNQEIENLLHESDEMSETEKPNVAIGEEETVFEGDCPACGAYVSANDATCPGCELSLR